MTKEQIKAVLDKHLLWINGEPGGEVSNLTGANLTGANLSGADLSGADLERKQMDPIVKHELFSPLGPMADAQAFGQCLARHGIIQSIALEDPEEYDSLRTGDAIRSIYDEISAHFSARAEEALDILRSAID